MSNIAHFPKIRTNRKAVWTNGKKGGPIFAPKRLTAVDIFKIFAATSAW
jgi:hypothetical protein